MAYFPDLSDYAYHSAGLRPGTKNIAWLECGRRFDSWEAPNEILDLLWAHCEISVVQTRGTHRCDLCDPPKTVFAARLGRSLWLGSSEIRVLSRTGEMYAAPNLVYHYVRTHGYKPPDEFINALRNGPRPSADKYFERLKNANLDWRKASGPGQASRTQESAGGICQADADCFRDES